MFFRGPGRFTFLQFRAFIFITFTRNCLQSLSTIQIRNSQNQKLSKSTNTTHFPSYRSFFVQSHVHPCQCLSTSDVFQKMFEKKDEVFFSYVENASNRYGVILTCLPSNHAAPFGPRQAMQEIFQLDAR